jgi:hypothetical protein
VEQSPICRPRRNSMPAEARTKTNTKVTFLTFRSLKIIGERRLCLLLFLFTSWISHLAKVKGKAIPATGREAHMVVRRRGSYIF